MKPSVRASSVEGLRQELKDLRRQVMDLQRRGEPRGGASDRELGMNDLTDADTTTVAPNDGDTLVYASSPGLWLPGAPSGGGAGGVPTLYVASANATTRSQEIADYVCDGTSDHVEIAAAIAALSGSWGGRVVLSEGDFYLGSTLTLGWGMVLDGLGLGTYMESTATTALVVGDGATARNFELKGPNTGGTTGVTLGWQAVLEGAQVSRFGTGVEVLGGSDYSRVASCWLMVQPSGYSVVVGAAEGVMVRGCHIEEGVHLNGCDRAQVMGNFFLPGGGITVSSGNANCIADNYLYGGAGSFSDSGTTTQRGTNFSSTGTW